jgi:hypothetical protein
MNGICSTHGATVSVVTLLLSARSDYQRYHASTTATETEETTLRLQQRSKGSKFAVVASDSHVIILRSFV